MAVTEFPNVTLPNQATGTDLTLDAVDGTNGNKFKNTPGKTYLLVRNAGGSSITVTIPAKKTSRGGDNKFPPQTVSAISGAVAAGGFRWFGPFASSYNDGDGYCEVQYSSGTSVTADVLQVE